jgi:hypothetical protein
MPFEFKILTGILMLEIGTGVVWLCLVVGDLIRDSWKRRHHG